MFKRILAILISALLIFCISTASFAEETNTPPEMPSGDMTPPDWDGSQPPEKPDGSMTPPDRGDGQPPEKPDGSRPGGPGEAPDEQQNRVEGQLGSWSLGGTDASSAGGNDYAYDVALYVTTDGIVQDKSAVDRISEGSYDDDSAENIVINDSESGRNGILVYNTDYAVSGAEITMLTEADGTDTCDFSGKGTAIAAFGSDANVTVTDSTIHTSGVATMPIFADDGATVTIRSSVLQSDGGTLSADYLNTPSQTLMVAPPWILGIMGNFRCSNMMGTNTTTNVIDSETSAGAWAPAKHKQQTRRKTSECPHSRSCASLTTSIKRPCSIPCRRCW